jgi:hypothetical protein
VILLSSASFQAALARSAVDGRKCGRGRGAVVAASKPAQEQTAERIDGIVALIMAIGRAMVAQEQPQPEYSPFFV